LTSYCSDGWKPLNSYTCTCKSTGFQPGSNFTTCVDVNECLLPAPPCPKDRCINTFGSFNCCESGTTATITGDCIDVNECIPDNKGKVLHNCAKQEQCVNTLKEFVCCPTGYRNPDPYNRALGTLDVCEDVDECAEGSNNCLLKTQCYNTPGSFGCCPSGFYGAINSTNFPPCEDCFSSEGWVLSESGLRTTQFPSLAKFPYKFDFKYCGGTCDSGIAPYQQASIACPGTERTRAEACVYACSNLTAISNAEAAQLTIQREFSKIFSPTKNQTFINNILSYFNSSGKFIGRTKRSATSSSSVFQLSTCNRQIVDVVTGIIKDLVPNAPSLTTKIDSRCILNITSVDPVTESSPNLIPIIVGAIIGITIFFIVVVVAVYFYFKYKSRVDWSSLPPEITWSYRQYESKPGEWDFRGSKHSSFFYKDLPPQSKEYYRVKELYDAFGGKALSLTQVTAVYNPTLVTNFIGAHKIMNERLGSSGGLFGRQLWRATNDSDEMQKREKCYDHFAKRMKSFAWNNDSRLVSIVPVCHGTDLPTAEKIAETGFANLSSVDEGYYGKGIYFTTYALYTIPYLGSKQPVILLSWAIPGNVYPVIESHNSPGSLLGTALKSGHNSHYVRTRHDGTPCNFNDDSEVFDELVIAQESQIAPAFLLHVDVSSKRVVHKQWLRQMRPRDNDSVSNSGVPKPQPTTQDISFDASRISLEDDSNASF